MKKTLILATLCLSLVGCSFSVSLDAKCPRKGCACTVDGGECKCCPCCPGHGEKGCCEK